MKHNQDHMAKKSRLDVLKYHLSTIKSDEELEGFKEGLRAQKDTPDEIWSLIRERQYGQGVK